MGPVRDHGAGTDVGVAPTALCHHLDRARSRLGLAGCIDGVLLPCLHTVDLRWRRGLVDGAERRVATEVARAWLERVALGAPAADDVAPVVLACAPGERDVVALEALAAVLRHERRPCRILGARTSHRSLRTAVQVNRPHGVVVAAYSDSVRVGAIQSLQAVAGYGADLYYIGAAFGTATLRDGVPGTYLGTSIQAACALLSAVDHPRVVS